MTIKNNGTTPDRLIGGSIDVADRFQLHAMTMEDGIAKMRELSDIEIKPGQTIEFKPGGSHVMFVNLKHPLSKGEHINGTLVFEHAGTVNVRVQRRRPWRATGSAGHGTDASRGALTQMSAFGPERTRRAHRKMSACGPKRTSLSSKCASLSRHMSCPDPRGGNETARSHQIDCYFSGCVAARSARAADRQSLPYRLAAHRTAAAKSIKEPSRPTSRLNKPTSSKCAVNVKAAKAIGLTIPPGLLVA